MAAVTLLLLLLLVSASSSSSRAQRPGLFQQVYFLVTTNREVVHAHWQLVVSSRDKAPACVMCIPTPKSCGVQFRVTWLFFKLLLFFRTPVSFWLLHRIEYCIAKAKLYHYSQETDIHSWKAKNQRQRFTCHTLGLGFCHCICRKMEVKKLSCRRRRTRCHLAAVFRFNKEQAYREWHTHER